MAKYVDGFVFVVPKKNISAYKKMAKEASTIWKKFGALEYKECVGNDLNPSTGGTKMAGFTKISGMKAGETVWFSYIVFKSRAHRDAVNKKVMAYFDKKYAGKEMPMPFDLKRFSYGGFDVVVES